MPKKRKGFKTSPSIRIPRAAATKMQAAAAAAAAAADNLILRAALKDAVAIIDEERAGRSSYSREDAIRLERIRALATF